MPGKGLVVPKGPSLVPVQGMWEPAEEQDTWKGTKGFRGLGRGAKSPVLRDASGKPNQI